MGGAKSVCLKFYIVVVHDVRSGGNNFCAYVMGWFGIQLQNTEKCVRPKH